MTSCAIGLGTRGRRRACSRRARSHRSRSPTRTRPLPNPRVESTATLMAQNTSTATARVAANRRAGLGEQRDQCERDDRRSSPIATRNPRMETSCTITGVRSSPNSCGHATTSSAARSRRSPRWRRAPGPIMVTEPRRSGWPWTASRIGLGPSRVRPIDLHTHSSVSDGTETPTQLVRAARRRRASARSRLTDHDSTAGWQEAFAAAGRHRACEVLPGHGAQHELRARERAHARLPLRSVRMPRSWPRPRGSGMAACTVPSGSSIGSRPTTTSPGTMCSPSPTEGATIGRPHIADALVSKGHVPTRSAAFESILHWRSGYYEQYYAPSPLEGVRMIVAAGGCPVLAHPATHGPMAHDGGRRDRRPGGCGPARASRSTTATTSASGKRWLHEAGGPVRPDRDRRERLPRRGQAQPPRREHDQPGGARAHPGTGDRLGSCSAVTTRAETAGGVRRTCARATPAGPRRALLSHRRRRGALDVAAAGSLRCGRPAASACRSRVARTLLALLARRRGVRGREAST